MTKKLNIGVLFGGRSGEHEVSIVSARSVIKALDKSKYKVIPIGITKQGQWIAGSNSVKLLEEGKSTEGGYASPRLELGTRAGGKSEILEILAPDPTRRELVPINPKQATQTKKIDVIFPVLHGPYGEDGTVQGLFELANIPYVGAGVLGSAVGMDKIIQKRLFKEASLPIVDFVFFLAKEWKIAREKTISRIEKLKYPVFVKPANLGSSVGISKAHHQKELVTAVNLAINYDRKIIVEKGIDPIREIEVSVLGNDSPKASLVGEVKSSNEFYDYNAKYVDGASITEIPARLSKSVMKKIQALAVKAFKSLDCAGMARVDFLLGPKNKIYLNEVNTIPGFTAISMYPKLWEASGMSYPELLDELIKLARERHREKNKLATSFKPRKDWHKIS